MKRENLFSTLGNTPAVHAIQQQLEQGKTLSCSGVAQSAQPFLAVLLRYLFPTRPVIVVTAGVKLQESFHQDIETWLRYLHRGGELSEKAANSNRELKAYYYPAWEVLPHESKLPHADVISERMETLVGLSANPKASGQGTPLIVTNAMALMQRTFAPQVIENRTRTLSRGDRIEPLDLIEWLEEQGYEPEAQVTQKGEIALRGGILDVYPLTSPWPVRLEFFGDELESLRYFDPATQISRETIDTVPLPPAGEIGILKRISSEENEEQNGSTLSTLVDHLPKDSVFLYCSPEALDETVGAYALQIPDRDPFFTHWDDLMKEIGARGLAQIFAHESDSMSLETLNVSEELHGRKAAPSLHLPLGNLDAFRPLGERSPEPQIADAQRREFFSQLHRWLRQGYSVHVFCNNDGEQQRFTEIWQEYGLSSGSEPNSSKKKASTDKGMSHVDGLHLHLGALARGFLFEPPKVVVVTDAEIFGRYKVLRPRRLKSPHAAAARSALDIDFSDLEEGDYVVHLQHGIGRYQGLKALPPSLGRKSGQPVPDTVNLGQECLVIEYAPSDPEQPAPKLYVPVSEAHLVSKYVGTGKARPQLNTLGGTKWAKAKAQAEEAVRDLASELLAMQAARESQPGHSFKPDSPWQREFESAFLYEETPDQLRAIQETKHDMESARPMDRLICGDVGYGKTEVAIRAAFKAVMDGHQVALLVPTTILAQQHFNTFVDRMADYPVRIEQLSRFRTRREQKKILQQLAEGSIDIVIGTHRLVQEDVVFKNLGLIIIDEEQRFGVLHKEKLKLLRRLVDVLTLSATPIPRTLYLALTGARDMSTIETPPQDRLPVETVVTQFEERIIREAIQRELNRQGQIYYLQNQVHDIQDVANRIKTLVPKARIIVGHGQMESDELEEIMAKFINGEADVLVSTTIIESGIDIPNANTIIIDRADRFGLSDLYQLRGRVGRYKHQAYAYLLLPRHATLLTDVRKRISAIKQYSSLGSGFKIAMRDLEIRGAGNLLGSEQSGHITAVGFDLYCQLLKQSVSTLKGEKVRPRTEVAIRLDFLAFNPAEGDAAPANAGTTKEKQAEPAILVPRDIATYSVKSEKNKSEFDPPPMQVAKAAAYIPVQYIAEPRQRIEIYRKLAQITDKASIEQLRSELLDRFGKPPSAVELLLQVAEMKSLASERAITAIESKDDKVMLKRHNDYITIAGKFPRLTKRDAKARLNEIKKLLLALSQA